MRAVPFLATSLVVGLQLAHQITDGAADASTGNVWFVSNEARNGFPVGNDSTGTGTATAPWLTINGAIGKAAVTAGDTIYVNGTLYTESLGYVHVNKAISVRAIGSVELRGSNATRSLYVNVSTGGNILIGGFTVNANAVSTNCIQFATVATKYKVTLTGLNIQNAVTFNVGSINANHDVEIYDCAISGSSTAGGVNLAGIASGSVKVSGLRLSLTGINATNGGGVYVRAGATGVTAYVTGVTGTVATTSSSAVSVSGVLLQNIPDARILNCSIDITSTSASAGVTGYGISAYTSAPLDSARGKIMYCTGYMNTVASGYFAINGQDANGADANFANDAEIAYCSMRGNATNAAAGIHGFMLGNCTGGEIHHCDADTVGIAFLSKYNNGAVHHNTGRGAKSQYLRGKASTATFNANTMELSTAGNGVFLYADHDNVIPANVSNCVFTNNVGTVASGSPVAVTVASTSTSTFTSNTYNGAFLNWQYQGTTYNSLAAWKAAREASALP